tara:strand:+ start:1115 stop:1852 length:738 start_codon:yes stop_codon:yes gene_type:complete
MQTLYTIDDAFHFIHNELSCKLKSFDSSIDFMNNKDFICHYLKEDLKTSFNRTCILHNLIYFHEDDKTLHQFFCYLGKDRVFDLLQTKLIGGVDTYTFFKTKNLCVMKSNTLRAWKPLNTEEIRKILDTALPKTIDLNINYLTQLFDVFPDLKKQFCSNFSKLPKEQIKDTIDSLNKNKYGQDILKIILFNNSTNCLRSIGFFDRFQEQKNIEQQSNVVCQRNYVNQLCFDSNDEIQDQVGSFIS